VHYHPAGFLNDIWDNDDHTVTVMPRSQVTSSSLCIFDRDADEEGQQFRSLFTQDPKAFPTYKMTATNPGQFYYNVFATGTPEETATVTVTLPYPFVTQGAMPIHAYSGVSVATNGETCFVPTGEFYADGQQVVLSDYTLKYDATSSVGTQSLDVEVEIPASGFVYLSIHLDYGLKGARGYSADTSANARNAAGDTILIPNLADHTFAVSDGQDDETTVENMNVFKKNPGVGGLVVTAASTNPDQPPFQGATVQLKKGKTLVGTAQTDEDGWHIINYKHTGKAADFNVVLSNVPGKPGYTETKKVTLKANAYSEVNFELK